MQWEELGLATVDAVGGAWSGATRVWVQLVPWLGPEWAERHVKINSDESNNIELQHSESCLLRHNTGLD